MWTDREIRDTLTTLANDRILSCYAAWLRVKPDSEENRKLDKQMEEEINKLHYLMEYIQNNL